MSIQNATPEDQDMVDDIFQFNAEILGVKQTGIRLLTTPETEYLHKCLIEEADELKEALIEGDVINQVDACIDSVYFAIGGLYRMGLTPTQVRDCIFAVHLANMEKKKGVNARRDYGVEDAVKPEAWVPPEERIAEILSEA